MRRISYINARTSTLQAARLYGTSLRGTVIIGATGTGKSYLLQYQALEALRRNEDSELIYVGTTVRQDPILSIQNEAHISEEKDGFLLIRAERMTAYFCDTSPGSAEVERVKSVILDTLAAALAPDNNHKYILALDGMFSFFRSDGEAEEIWWMLKKVLDTATNNITFLATFQTANDIRSAFGEAGVQLFARMDDKFILRCFDDHDLASFVDCQDINPINLQRGEALHFHHGGFTLVDFGLDSRGTVTVGSRELKEIGIWRQGELRSESYLSDIAGALCFVLLLGSVLVMVNFFHEHRDIFETKATGSLGTVLYAASLIATALMTAAFPYMRSCVAAWLITLFELRHAKRLTE